MKSSRNYFHNIIALTGGLAFVSAVPLHVQSQVNFSQAEGLQLVSTNAIPKGGGTFWSWQKQGAEPPLPFDPFPLLPLYAAGNDGTFIYDDSSVNYVTLKDDAAAHLALQKAEQKYGLETPTVAELGIYGDSGSGMATMESEGPPTPPGAGEGGGGGTNEPPSQAYSYPTNSLWLEITSVTNGQANLIVHGTVPDGIYEILSRVILSNVPWASEGTIIGAPDQDWTPTTAALGTRTNSLFFWARSWADSDGGGLPDWWQLQFFGHFGVDPYADPDGDGWMNIEEWQNGTAPNSFDAPPTPAAPTVFYHSANMTANISWGPSPGAVTNHVIERINYDVYADDELSFGPDTLNFTDTLTLSDATPLYSPVWYRFKAQYTGGESDWSPWTPILNFPSSSMAQVVRGDGGHLYFVISGLGTDVTEVRLYRYEYDNNSTWTTLTNFAMPLTNGVFELPESWTPRIGASYGWTVQITGADGRMTDEAFTGYFSTARIPFFDGRVQLKQNVNFLTQVPNQSQTFRYIKQSQLGGWNYYAFPSNYVHSSLFKTRDDDDCSDESLFDPFLPFKDNHLFRNFVFSESDVDSTGRPTTGFWGNGVSDYDCDLVTSHFWPVLLSPEAYRFSSPTNLISIPGLLGATETRWLYYLPLSVSGGFLPGINITLAGNRYYMTNTTKNYFGLSFLSAKFAYQTNSALSFSELNAGGNMPVVGGYVFHETTTPQLLTTEYYFAQPGIDPLPGQKVFSVTNSTQVLIAECGQPSQFAGYAKQEILNGYAGASAYLGQYFERTFKVATNGVVTTNQTGILSPYGEFFPTEPGPTALVTMPADTNSNTRGTCLVHVISFNVDGNHDGEMDFSYFGPDQTTPTLPFRFWINDDNDGGETKGDDIPNNKRPNGNDGVVNGVRDLVDFFPVYLNIQSLLQALPESPSITVWLKQGDNALRFIDPDFYFDDLRPTNCLAYLTETNIAQFIGRTILPSAETFLISDSGTFLNSGLVAKIRNEGKGILLIEALKPTTEPLDLEVRYGTNVIAQAKLHLSITGVEQMFRQKNLIRGVWTNSIAGWPDRLNDADVPNEPENNGKNFVFLHGYNVNPTQARGTFAETFKRMYWSGSRAKFYGVNYYGYESQLAGKISPNLQTNIVNAFLTAPKLKLFLDTITNSPTTVAAHSLGNMVALSALSDWNAPVTKYFMIDAAVAIEAIDGGAAWSTNMVHSDWLNYSSRLWASHWFRIFPTNDYRSGLTWSNRFANLPIANIYNFYSSGEEVLRTHTGTTPDFTEFAVGQVINAVWYGTPASAYVWAFQEKLKGRSPYDSVLSSTHGGWRFNAAYNDGFGNHLPPAQAALLPDSQLRTNSFFQVHSPEFLSDFALLGADASAYAQTNRNRILADAIPAITLPVAANPVPKLSPQNQPSQNFNMNALYQNGWPSTRPGGQEVNKWYHSDFKDVAYLYVYKLFDEFVNEGNLK